MRAGKLRHRIQIHTYTEAADAVGQPIKTYALSDTRWGSIEPMSGKELEWAKQISSQTTHKIMMRYFAGLTTEDRLVSGGTTYEILSILNHEERNAELEIMAVVM